MSFDEDLKHAFERHAGDTKPEPGAWSGVERRIRRSHRVRAAMAAAGGAAAIVAAAVVVPTLLSGRGERIGPPAQTPSPTPTTAAVANDWNAFRSERDGYWLRYPKDWRFGEFEAHVSFQPPGLPGIEEGGETFGIELWIEQGKYDDPSQFGEASLTSDTTVAGRSAKVRQTTFTSEPPSTTRQYWVEWSGYSCPPNIICTVADNSVLMILIQSRSPGGALWDRYADVADQIVRSIVRSNAAGGIPANTVVHTRRGSVAASVPYDGHTASVVTFMDARIEGGGAEQRLTADAKQQYEKHEGRLSLYSPNEKTTYSSYEVISRAGVDANSYEYTVHISYVVIAEGGTEERRSRTETVGVGPGAAWDGSHRGWPVIRFAQLMSDNFVGTPAQG